MAGAITVPSCSYPVRLSQVRGLVSVGVCVRVPVSLVAFFPSTAYELEKAALPLEPAVQYEAWQGHSRSDKPRCPLAQAERMLQQNSEQDHGDQE